MKQSEMPLLRSLYALPPELITLIAGSLCAHDKVNLLRAFPLLLPVLPRRVILETDGYGAEFLYALSPVYNDSHSDWDTTGEEESGEDEEVGLAGYPEAILEHESTYIACPDTDTDASSQGSPIYIPSQALAPGSRAGPAHEGNNMVHVLAQTGDLRLLRALAILHNTPPLPVDRMNHRDRTPVSLACEAGHLPIVEFLADCSPSGLVSWDEHGIMPVSWAARGGHAEIVRFLLTRPAITSLSPKHWFEKSACAAAREGRADVVGVLVEAMNSYIDRIQARARAQAEDNHSAAAAAAVNGNDATVNNYQNATQCAWLPLRYAIDEGYTDIVEKLLQVKTLDISRRGLPWRKTPLFLACRRGNASIVELLLDKDSSNINAGDPSGKTALAHARESGNIDIAELLAARGAVE
ncbi:hypothetical protein ASPCAL05679 [Aspergillus calidoustus]|uniref:Uncharacterized protein n=1 Tax=Aspergillus calidoustus TaxID=454130 RepID=A0A0U5G0B5_ASPCI|nr:hypothetical protein ASPCAL05679 [Aspergillus calidoustus]